ncbi:MAG: nitroreductase family protein [Candidatus Cloacimonetes bacterium]|nr:nitroreductase family protein [Candidatus Cloacimonadota bacterium]
MLKDLIRKNRSYRRFDNNCKISKETLLELIDLARLSPSSANLQPLKYKLIYTTEECAKVFPFLSWAGYLPEWQGPQQAERPTAYIIIKREIEGSRNYAVDAGIACQSILLGATEKGLGGCIFGAVQREKLHTALAMNDEHEIVYVIALGKPVEEVIIEDVKNGDIKYWRDENNKHHVPKRKLADIIEE